MSTIFRSEFDPKDSDDGGIDAVGLSSMGEYLGQLYLPGLLERHRRPRFLTISAIGLSIKGDVENLLSHKEYETTFWEAFEWVIVTGLISSKDSEIKNLPSSDKAKTAMAQGKPLNADRYLVTPSVFGFHGVYKFLLKNLGLEQHDCGGEFCQKLVEAWAKDQKILGFIGQDGDGATERKELIRIVAETIQNGEVVRAWNFRFWEFIYKNFHPLRLGSTEKKVITDLLLNEERRKEVLLFLDNKGKRYIENHKTNQREYLTALHKEVSRDLKKTIDVILCYEQFARTLNDIFYDSLVELSGNSLGLSADEISKSVETKNKGFASRLYTHYKDAEKAILDHPDIDLQKRFEVFRKFESKFSSSECVNEVLTHHLSVQLNKSTGAKNPWIFEVQGRWMVRASYAHRNQATHDDSFVNLYRLGVLRLFFSDLGGMNA